MSEAVEKVKKYDLRDLKSKDIFLMINIISCIGVKEFRDCFKSDEVKETITAMKKGKQDIDVETVGVGVMLDIADVIISNITNAEQYIYQFLAGLSGISKKELEDLDMITFIEMIMDVFSKKEFKDFFKVVLRYAK